jgi:hypothetical protein
MNPRVGRVSNQARARLRLRLLLTPKTNADFFTVVDDYRRLKPSQTTSRRGFAANSTEWTLSHYNTDSIVSFAYTISADGGADLAHVKSSSTMVD